MALLQKVDFVIADTGYQLLQAIRAVYKKQKFAKYTFAGVP